MQLQLPHFLTLLASTSSIWAARILIVLPFDMDSQCKFVTPYLQALLERGHQVTIIHAFYNCPIINRLHAIHIEDRYNSALDISVNVTSGKTSKWGEMQSLLNFIIKICLNVLDNEEVQQLLSSGVSYDLMVLEPSYTDALFGMAAHFNATLIGLATCGGDWNLKGLVGSAAYSSHEPILHNSYQWGKSVLDRVYNSMHISEEWLLQTLIFLPRLRAVHEHFFGHLKQSFSELRQSFALILLNQHFSLFEARPNVPNLVEVGGMHVPKQVPQLPADLAQFIQEAPHGVICMVLGVDLPSKDLPAATLAIILDTFATLPQRIVWKFEGSFRPNASSNIYFSPWLPQQAILAQANVRLFITHGGILSIIEAVHYGKPVLGMPLIYDQFRNVHRLQVEGVAKRLDINSLTRRDFETTVKELIEQPQYQRKALALSQRFQDQSVHPLDAAVYWTEYVHRHKGATFMRVSRSNMKLLDYYAMDNVVMVAIRIGFLACLLIYVLRTLLRCLNRVHSTTGIW